ncbi:hypothetical protein JCM10908_007167 [Rhodotorula pacifica]|uniref:RTA1 domain-containing protein n=1 Tax=Rhodotorula pacifica TaxID=1495444 RepID=UPI00317FFCFB
MSSGYAYPKGVPVNPKDPIPDSEAPISIFGYIPNRTFAIVALITFCVAVLVHSFYLVRFRGTRTFQALIAFGALCEVVGYAARLTASKNPFIVVKFVIQYFFIVVAPVFFQAAFYIALAGALKRLDRGGRALLGFNPKILVAVMITADVITTIVQIAGAALIGVAESTTYRDGQSSTITSAQANDILLAGLSLQTASFLAFLSLLAVCIVRSRKAQLSSRLPRRFTTVLFVASLLVFLRTTFRLAETAEGVFSYASRTEPLFAGLEYLPVILAVLLFAAFPLYKLLPPKQHTSHVSADEEQHRLAMQAETSNASEPTLVRPGSQMVERK